LEYPFEIFNTCVKNKCNIYCLDHGTFIFNVKEKNEKNNEEIATDNHNKKEKQMELNIFVIDTFMKKIRWVNNIDLHSFKRKKYKNDGEHLETETIENNLRLNNKEKRRKDIAIIMCKQEDNL